MTTLTSIASLRKSDALQDRVTRVENFLKSINRDWKPEWWFPISVIYVSNESADCNWVRDHTGTHLKDKGDVRLGAHTVSARSVIDACKGLTLRNREDLNKINDALSKAFGTLVAWDNGIQTVTADEPQVTHSEEAQQTTEQGQTAPESNLVSEMTAKLVGMETADIMAVLTAVNSARGGLLRGAQPDELTTFIHAMTGNRALTVDWPAGVNA